MLFLYSLLGFLIIPITAKWAILKKGPGFLNHHSVDVRRIRPNPFPLSLTISDFELLDPAGSRLAGFERFLIDFELSSLSGR
jgi:hypothetical protein